MSTPEQEEWDGDLTMLEHARMVEALLFAAAEPLDEETIAEHLPERVDVARVLKHLLEHYAPRGVRLVQVGGCWAFRTAPDLAPLLRRDRSEPRKLSRAAVETLAIIAYHQPVTRAEIEAIRGVSVAKGTLDVLVEAGWVRLRGRRRTPGRPVTFGTTPRFLDHFGLNQISDLPGLDELKAAGFFDGRLPSAFDMPLPFDDPALRDDEDPVEPDMRDFFETDVPDGPAKP
ncbi:segregation and condensation protein B [Agaricicola taiwanensis]|uniref:Segregation and condensation protein B n=1 Tax=Agaricicola taiwanensis TaxID=591372 RepID=A0A8J2YII9_9RHOB|nr:SMC-Scp complex subunit ScpB [Agaricicola taiwanensis]GGE45346.1 segregation and condensation protein B [Agaricicola taiwanensis]